MKLGNSSQVKTTTYYLWCHHHPHCEVKRQLIISPFSHSFTTVWHIWQNINKIMKKRKLIQIIIFNKCNNYSIGNFMSIWVLLVVIINTMVLFLPSSHFCPEISFQMVGQASVTNIPGKLWNFLFFTKLNLLAGSFLV